MAKSSFYYHGRIFSGFNALQRLLNKGTENSDYKMNNVTSPNYSTIKNQEGERRSDEEVRDAIDEIQGLLFNPRAAFQLFPALLKRLVSITGSDFGSIVAIEADNQVRTLADGVSNLRFFHSASVSGEFHDSVISTWINKGYMPKRSVFFNDPIPRSHCALLKKPTETSSICLLPVIIDGSIRAVFLLGKSRGNYSVDRLGRLLPLIAAVSCALRSAKSVEGSLFGLNKKISDNNFLSTMLASSPLGILVVDEFQSVVISNPAALHMFNAQGNLNDQHHQSMRQRNPFQGMDIRDFIPAYDELFQWSKQDDRYCKLKGIGSPKVWEHQSVTRLDGSIFSANISVFRYTYEQQQFTTLQLQDMSALHAGAQEHQNTLQQLTALTHLVPVGIVRVDINWECSYSNDKWHDISGLSEDETDGLGWINALHSDDVSRVLEDLRECLQKGEAFHAVLRIVTPLGELRWVDLNTQVLFNELGLIDGFLGTVADITERLTYQEKLRRVAEYDALTGLANRNLFQDRLQQAFYTSERTNSQVVVMFMDLDGFKDVNDSLGHDSGDTLLKLVASRLLNELRSGDTVARFGGDEFVILLSDDNSDQYSDAIAAKIVNAIGKPYPIDGQDVFVTASVGIASGNHSDCSPEQILKQADAALYLAKGEGKNNFQVFNDALDQESKARIKLLNLLRVATQLKSFDIAYQPQANTKDKTVVGVEALLRYTDPSGNEIPISEIIPLLEESGLIIEVGKWVISQACKQHRSWLKAGVFSNVCTLSINVSPKQLLDESTIEAIIDSCQRYELSGRLIVEITESVLIDKPNKVKVALEKLKSAGITIALDDFGTGYSSLTYLQRYPFDHIKIDKSFVIDVADDESNAKITVAIITLAKSLGLKITAEGVSNAKSLAMLEYAGADFYQGFYLGKPMLPSQVENHFQGASANASVKNNNENLKERYLTQATG